MGKFLDEIKSSATQQRGILEKILADLPKADAEDLRTAIADLTISAPQICRALAKRGIKLSTSVIYRWRENNQ